MIGDGIAEEMFGEVDQVGLFLAGEASAFELGVGAGGEKIENALRRGAAAGEMLAEPPEENIGDGAGYLLGIDRFAEEDEVIAAGRRVQGPIAVMIRRMVGSCSRWRRAAAQSGSVISGPVCI